MLTYCLLFILPVLFLLLGVIDPTTACGQATDDKLGSEQKKILNLYASEYLLKDYQHLYYKSENSYYKSEYLLKVFLEPPLTPEDFKLPKFSTLPGRSQQYLDTLFSEQELQAWSSQIEEYVPITWNQELFPDSVSFIREEEIPKYLNRTDIPPPRQDPVFIHYISPPFMYQNKSALMYARKWRGIDAEISYLYFIKQDDRWKLKERGRLNVGY
ncbi:MAG TPA: hypothetical protein VK112_11165 [Fodinibius sp.]|nr:hypothetical protein [Fodinibius sp.]